MTLTAISTAFSDGEGLLDVSLLRRTKSQAKMLELKEIMHNHH